MAQISDGAASGVKATVDAIFKALRFSARPIDYSTFGHYRVAGKSGALTGVGIVAGAPLFSARWGDATRFAVLLRLRAWLDVTTIFTAAQELALDAILVRPFQNNDSAGTALTPVKVKTSMGASLFSDMRIANTTLLTAGAATRTVDPTPFSHSNPAGERVVNAAAATAYLPSPPQVLVDYNPDIASGEHPIVLAASEGFLIRNVVAFPAAGAATLAVEASWAEVAAY